MAFERMGSIGGMTVEFDVQLGELTQVRVTRGARSQRPVFKLVQGSEWKFETNETSRTETPPRTITVTTVPTVHRKYGLYNRHTSPAWSFHLKE